MGLDQLKSSAQQRTQFSELRDNLQIGELSLQDSPILLVGDSYLQYIKFKK
jgi:hypothetical protein